MDSHSGELRNRNATPSEGETSATIVETTNAEPPRGKPVQVVVVNPDHTFSLAEKELERILLSDSVRNKEVVVLSVAGAFRKGKSFLLDFLLRFLEHNCDEAWLNDQNQPLTGFSWRGGSERETTGIWVWDRPFVLKVPSGSTHKEVAVLLMDTQGTFDRESTVKDNVTIFGMSTMLSSIQVYNLTGGIQEDDLQHLHLFTEYGKLAASGELDADAEEKPFQSLLFLIRDWAHLKEYQLGSDGGSSYLEKTLQVEEGQHDDLKSVRQHIRSCFDDIRAFLLPHPGFEVTEDPNFDGRVSLIRPHFIEHMKSLAMSLLSSDSLVLKKVNGETITAKQLFAYFQAYHKIYQSADLPQPKTILEATAEANNTSIRDVALEMYEKTMEHAVGADRPFLPAEKFEDLHKTTQEACLEKFRKAKKMGGADFASRYEKELADRISQRYATYKELNDSKASLSTIRTPLTLCIIAVTSHVMSSILDLLFLSFIGDIIDCVFYVCVAALLAWSVATARGGMDPVLQFTDQYCGLVWEEYIVPGWGYAMQQGATMAIQSAQKRVAGAASNKSKSD
eukprot:TRINITY_DN3191_c0_g1::TRINITY_DN3191_c0_g1_i1::g.3530::m.3530 TRINITY_DN3191_c0_g1::TRINITY_DN3191_c0_g1_i1::g.3530  ORF type:complete len:582 (-),score=191.75,sp/Q58D72/ATLA1_BOVIN/47.04/8e-165,GBP/PF02263.14/2.9e-76,GBP_C/PF02841.9/1.8e-05 TRINITY_DN3191_c0_g1_i1:1531-3225(-)